MSKRRPRAIGTQAETAVTRVAQHRGFPFADRRALRGRLDGADILLCPGAVIEVKGGEYAKTATDGQIVAWLDVLERKRLRDDLTAFLVTQRAGVGVLNAGRWWAWWRLNWLVDLGPHHHLPLGPIVVRCTLADALTILRAAGYGDPLDVDQDDLGAGG